MYAYLHQYVFKDHLYDKSLRLLFRERTLIVSDELRQRGLATLMPTGR